MEKLRGRCAPLARWPDDDKLPPAVTKPRLGIARDGRNGNMKLTTPEDLAIAARRRRRTGWILVSMLLAGVAFGSIAYKPWRLRSLNHESREAVAQGDYKRAAFLARRALSIDANYLPACITMAEAGEHDRASEAVFWREKVLRLVGESTDTLIGFASTALSFGKISSARSALQRVQENDRGRVDFLVLSGAMAMEEQDFAASARHYEAALRLNPENQEYRLALGRAKCASGDYLTREEGRGLLQDLIAHQAHGLTALRLLIDSLETHGEFQAALRHAVQLVALPAHTFSDEVLRLRLMHRAAAPDFANALADAQQSAKNDPKRAGALVLWMSMDGQAKEGLDWVLKRVPKLGQSPELRPAIAGCHLALNDWVALLIITQLGEWESAEYIRLCSGVGSIPNIVESRSAKEVSVLPRLSASSRSTSSPSLQTGSSEPTPLTTVRPCRRCPAPCRTAR